MARSSIRRVAAGFALLMLASIGQTYFISLSSWHFRHHIVLTGAALATLYMTATLCSAATLAKFGAIVDRNSPRRCVLYCAPMLALGCCSASVAGVGCIVLSKGSGMPALFTFMLLFGISNGFSLTLYGALWREVYGTRHPGAVRAAIVPVLVLVAALGPGLSGLLLDRGVSLPTILASLGAYCILISLATLTAILVPSTFVQ
jgi:MFS family permease